MQHINIFNLPKFIMLKIFTYFGKSTTRNYIRNVVNVSSTCKLFYSKYKPICSHRCIDNRTSDEHILPNIDSITVIGQTLEIHDTSNIRSLYLVNSQLTDFDDKFQAFTNLEYISIFAWGDNSIKSYNRVKNYLVKVGEEEEESNLRGPSRKMGDKLYLDDLQYLAAHVAGSFKQLYIKSVEESKISNIMRDLSEHTGCELIYIKIQDFTSIDFAISILKSYNLEKYNHIVFKLRERVRGREGIKYNLVYKKGVLVYSHKCRYYMQFVKKY